MLVSGAAVADIAAFNAAVKTGNYKAAAAEAKGVSGRAGTPPIRTRPRPRSRANSASQIMYRATSQRPATTASSSRTRCATLAKPYDQPATSSALLAAASFRLTANDATRKELFVAVKAREAAPGLDSMSMLAAEALYKADWAAGRWRDAGASGMSAYSILSRGGETLAPQALEARTTGAAGDFLGQRDKNDYDN
jgi:hypothetical protein